MTWRMAWRNLWRHRTRTLIMTSAVAFSYALFLVSMGMGDDGHGQMLEAAAEGAGGDVLVGNGQGELIRFRYADGERGPTYRVEGMVRGFRLVEELTGPPNPVRQSRLFTSG